MAISTKMRGTRIPGLRFDREGSVVVVSGSEGVGILSSTVSSAGTAIEIANMESPGESDSK